ncbi:putative manganese-dependent inorganic diphosphatase [Frisingicoccus sp.]|uniref:putative manganese-dependent inorganic diphosphatase n=1 Tax=Frisingicoccus sp. TaxID=1918627 RepID=UPI002EA2883A|nr:putative manganese-dependent inorganic diphosphatase [Frisingicoccus sp.]
MNNDKVYVIGHKHPDTDSICSAIAYAYLRKKVTGINYVPVRAGKINAETAFVLDRFGTEVPMYMEDVRTQVKDVQISPAYSGHADMSVRQAWQKLQEEKISTLTIVDKNEKLLGLITKGDIAKTYMGVYDSTVLSENRTPYKNILETLNGEMLVGDPNGVVEKGKVLIAAANPDLMEEYIEDGDMVMLGDRYESQLCAIEMNAGCLIISMNTQPNDTILKLAKEHNCTIIRTPYDTFIAARLLNQSMTVGHFMVEDMKTFKREDFIEDVKNIMANNRHRAFPVVDNKGKVLGMFTRHNLIDLDKKKVALVDHNEIGQAVGGITDCEIVEIVDHHKLGYVQSIRPVYFRCQPVGCTATIIYQMYRENKIEIPANMAGLMCSAILSDTLMYRSPTCTPLDRMAAEALAKIAGIEVEDYAMQMFEAGSDLNSKSDADIFYQDFKKFSAGNTQFGVGQITSLDARALKKIRTRLANMVTKAKAEHGLDMIFFMLTNILDESTLVLCSDDQALEVACRCFGVSEVKYGDSIFVANMVSRKKQFIPKMVGALQE